MKLSCISVDPELLAGMLMGACRNVVMYGIPADAKIVGAQMIYPHTIKLIVLSEAFEDVGPSGEVPELKITCKKAYHPIADKE